MASNVTPDSEGMMIYPDSELMNAGCEVAARVAESTERRVRLTQAEARSVIYLAVMALAYGAENLYPGMMDWRGRRYPDGSQDLTGRHLAATREYWRVNLPVILANRCGGEAE